MRCARVYPGIGGIYHAKIVRAVQLAVHDFMSQVASSRATGIAGVDLPDLSHMIKDLRQGTFQHSTNWVSIPEAYLDPIPAPHVIHGPGTATPSVSGTSAGTPSTTGGRSGVSSITAPSEAPTRVTRVVNTAPDAELSGIPLRPGGARQIMEAHPPPTNDAGTSQMCVAWWTRGGCYPNCRRHATHRAFASDGERSRLLAYVRERLQAPAT